MKNKAPCFTLDEIKSNLLIAIGAASGLVTMFRDRNMQGASKLCFEAVIMYASFYRELFAKDKNQKDIFEEIWSQIDKTEKEGIAFFNVGNVSHGTDTLN